MANSYYPQLYRCTDPKCNHSEKLYVWSKELETDIKICSKCSAEMTPEFEEVIQGPAYITTIGSKQMSTAQQAQRKARNRQKFKTDGIEQMRERDTDAFRYHKKKLGYKS